MSERRLNMQMVPYLVVSPVRNEAEYLQSTIDSMVGQTVRPSRWVIVDDGSTDNTREIALAAARTEPWITVVKRSDRGFRQAGGGVMDAFYAGFDAVESLAWKVLVKLDGDLSFSKDYFEQCLKRFESDPKLGIAGGTICNEVNGGLEAESKIDPVFHVRGATKIYRRECWDGIGGLIRAPGWDTVDEVKANMLGWRTCTFPDLQLVHHRPAGQAYGRWSNLIKNGRANYIAGYHPLFMLVKCARRLFEKPYLLEGCGLWIGFAGCYLSRVPRVTDKAVITYFRRQQMNRLLGKKSLWS
ncbi:MAG TPA: glycosyltransferase family A protein [Patescibacteria group bacterium]|nr:glycosyltransferase family A protein [Patescibacteria group bacterium]